LTATAKLSQAELARKLGVARQSINELVKSGVIPIDADGKIEYEAAAEALRQKVRPSSKSTASLDVQSATPLQTPAAKNIEATTETAAQTVEITSFHVAKTLREAAEAQIAQVKLKKMKGDLIEKESALKFAYMAARSVRDHLAGRRRSITPELAACAEIVEIEKLLEKSDQELLNNLVNTFQNFLQTPQSEVPA
jgi:DNA-binding transcriptional regulator LsrR (DeoR family)